MLARHCLGMVQRAITDTLDRFVAAFIFCSSPADWPRGTPGAVDDVRISDVVCYYPYGSFIAQ